MSTLIKDLEDNLKDTTSSTSFTKSLFQFSEKDLILLILFYTSSTDIFDKLIKHYTNFGDTVVVLIKIGALLAIFKIIEFVT